MEYYMDEKSRLSKNDSSSHLHTSSKSSSLIRSFSQKSSNSKSPLLRSFSQKNSSVKSSSLSRNGSLKSASSSKAPLSGSSSHKCSEFTRKCGSVAKEQKAKFYIVKRCITMLVCWKKHGDS